MRKRAKLTQEQLKSVLQGWKTTLLACCVWDIGEHLSDEHVYTQIEELIEDSGIEDSGVDEDLAAWMDKCHELGLEVAELKGKLEKPTVMVKEIMKRYPLAANEVIDFARWLGVLEELA